MVDYSWRGSFTNAELNALHAEGFGHRLLDNTGRVRWAGQPGLVCAREDSELVGFVNVAWDGGVHAFLLDTLVIARVRGAGPSPDSTSAPSVTSRIEDRHGVRG